MQWLMLQQNEPKDYVIASGKQYSVREFITWSTKYLGLTIKFSGKGLDEVGTILKIEGDLAPNAKNRTGNNKDR